MTDMSLSHSEYPESPSESLFSFFYDFILKFDYIPLSTRD